MLSLPPPLLGCAPLRRPSLLRHVPSPICAYSPCPSSSDSPWGCCVVLATGSSLSRLFLPYSRVFTPPGRQQPCSAGPLDPQPSEDGFVRLAQFAPFPLPLSPAPSPFTLHSLFPSPRAFHFSRGCCAALATRPSLSRPLFPSSRVYTQPGRRQPFGAGPLDPHPSETVSCA